jgi:diketogulonate reductase-like aldo/keto reductase
MKRRAFLWNAGLSASVLGAAAWARPLLAAQQLPRREIPGSADSLPVIGMGNSNAFRSGDRTASVDLIRLFHEHGGAYIDCSGDSRFVVAEAAHGLGIGSDLFLGSYFADGDDVAMRGEVRRLLAASGKDRLDLAHSYPEYAVPNWRQFQRWKDEGLTRYIGVARHQSDYYDSMMDLMKTGTVDFLQVNYSPLETEADRLVLPTAMDRGVAVTINRPFINGAYFAQVHGHPLPDWAAEFDCASWAQFSLKFILSHPAVTCVLTETANPEHLRDNIGAGFGRLPDPPMRNRMAEYLQGL